MCDQIKQSNILLYSIFDAEFKSVYKIELSFIVKRGCVVVVSTSEHHANEHGFESYTVKIINNYFPSVAQEEELLS